MSKETKRREADLSILMPNYNHSKYLKQAITAVLGQSRLPRELIIFDDGSTDNSLEILEGLANETSLIRIIRSDTNKGVIYGLNRLLSEASSEFVAFCACDDYLLPGFIEHSMSLLEKFPCAGLCSSLTREVDEHGVDRGIVRTPTVAGEPTYLSPEQVRRLLQSIGSWLQGNTVIYRREALIGAGGFVPSLRSFTDGFTGQVVALQHGACFVPRALAVWRNLADTYSAQSNADPLAWADMVDAACELMATRYGNVFPRNYHKLVAQEFKYAAARRAHSARWRNGDRLTSPDRVGLRLRLQERAELLVLMVCHAGAARQAVWRKLLQHSPGPSRWLLGIRGSGAWQSAC